MHKSFSEEMIEFLTGLFKKDVNERLGCKGRGLVLKRIIKNKSIICNYPNLLVM